jgi:2-methylisocitrate lyase-like PEP mutase family enzyme
LKNRRVEKIQQEGLVPVVGDVDKGYGKVNIMQILFMDICKWKNDTC